LVIYQESLHDARATEGFETGGRHVPLYVVKTSLWVTSPLS